MTAPQTLQRMHQLIWALIYGGLFLVVLGIASADAHAVAAWAMGVIGALATVAGGVLIVLFSIERVLRRAAGLRTARFGEDPVVD